MLVWLAHQLQTLSREEQRKCAHFSHSLFVHSHLLSLMLSKALVKVGVTIWGGKRVKHPNIYECPLISSQKPLAATSSLAPSVVFALRPERVSEVITCSSGRVLRWGIWFHCGAMMESTFACTDAWRKVFLGDGTLQKQNCYFSKLLGYYSCVTASEDASHFEAVPYIAGWLSKNAILNFKLTNHIRPNCPVG